LSERSRQTPKARRSQNKLNDPAVTFGGQQALFLLFGIARKRRNDEVSADCRWRLSCGSRADFYTFFIGFWLFG